MSATLEDRLREEDGTWPESWKPTKAGETLVGVVKQYSVGQGLYGPVRTVILQRADGSRISVWLSSKVLLSCFERERPSIGEKVGIKYQGRDPRKAYHRWSLIVERPETPISFEPLGGERGSDPDAFEDGDPFAPIPAQARR